jgi:hypothetical protein
MGKWSREISLLEGYSRRLARLVRQRFPIVVNMGNGPFWRLVQDSHFLWKWSGQSFLRVDSFSLGCTLFSAGGMAQGGEWSSSTIRDRHSLGQTHSLQVTLCLVSEEWPRVGNGPGSENQDNYSSLLEKNSPNSSSLMFTF